MCCFSGRVQSVSATSIFARITQGNRQLLVYSMNLKSQQDVAMILPLPTPTKTGERGVKFIDLSGYPRFFADMKRGFPDPPPPRMSTEYKSSAPQASAAPLPVLQVGSFEASFVPTIDDFSRLSPKFRLPATTWQQLPETKDRGFAVFKLKAGEKTIHPMAFDFPTRDPMRLFFPTLHIHDGKVHKLADFDHSLYCQRGPKSPTQLFNWRESPALASQFIDIANTRGLVDGKGHCYHQRVYGRAKNEDIWV